MKFKQFFAEMPYVEVEPHSPSDSDIFDLEFELLNGKTVEDLKKLFAKLFSGETFKDKYGNVVHIKTKSQKDALKKSIVKNPISLSMLKKLFGLNPDQVRLYHLKDVNF